MAKIVDPDSQNRGAKVAADLGFFIKKVFATMVLLFVFLISSTGKADASPSLLYSTYFGGGSSDVVNNVATDHLGNVYVTGFTGSENFPVKNAYQSHYGGGQYDAFLAKFSPQGNLIYSTFLGGSNTDQGTGVTVDNEGNVYVTGHTYSADFPIYNPYQNNNGGNRDAFVVKFSSDGGSLVYSTFLGGSNADLGYGITLGGNGNVYITGNTLSADFPSLNAFQNTYGGGGDAFIAEFLNNGSLVYSTYLGGSASDSGNGIAADSSGNAYIIGTTSSTNFPTLNAFDSNLDDGIDTTKSDAFVTKVSSNGALVYSTYLGGYGWNSGEIGNGIAVDLLGNVYVTGQTSSINFPVMNAFQNGLRGSSDIFVSKFSNDGSSLIYSTYLGGTCDATTGSGNEVGWSIKVDDLGKIYFTGMSVCTNYPLSNPVQSVRLGSYDATVTELSSDGSALLFSTYLGGGFAGVIGGFDVGRGVTVDDLGNIYIGGSTSSSNFPVLNAYQSSFGGGFVTKIGTNQPPTANAGTDQAGDEGQQFTFNGSGSTDPDGVLDITNYAWNFGDGSTGNGITANHSYSDNGVYTAILTVTDTANHMSSDTAQITVNNVVPSVGSLSPISPVLPSISINTGANFTDSGVSDTHLAAFDWGDGNVSQGLLIESNGSGSVEGSHVYASPGIYTITLTITDKDGGTNSNSTSVTILTPAQATQELVNIVQTYNLQQGIENSLDAKLTAAVDSLYDLNAHNDSAAINSLQAFINAVEAQRGNKITNEQANTLVQKAQEIINHLI